MIVYELDGERLADTTACAGVRADLKMCLLMSDCCKKVSSNAYKNAGLIYMVSTQDKKTPRECLQGNNVPSECQVLRNTFFECKRSLVSYLKKHHAMR